MAFNPIGNWEVKDKDFKYFQITINIDGTAKCTTATTKEGPNVHSGHWELIKDHLTITWDNGWRDILSPVENGYKKISYAPNTDIKDKPSHECEAIKLS